MDPINRIRPCRTFVSETDYATVWSCRWTTTNLLTEHDFDLLRHVNCSYLSSSKPPTLLALKQHAQSLAILISKLTVSTAFGAVGDEELQFRRNETFDWLSNLDEPYTNDDEYHNLPLFAIHSNVRGRPGVARSRCPLTEIDDEDEQDEQDDQDLDSRSDDGPPMNVSRTHHDLVMHANDCLEILDHELSATGGLMSLLPSEEDEDEDDMAAARNTLLGQNLLFQQHLVGRMHELEINYARALDVLAGEASVPLQLISRAGCEARSLGRQVGFPQDRFLLVNADDEVTRSIHGLLDSRETQMEQDESTWRSRGVSGDRMWGSDDEGEEMSRGLVTVDAMSRFSRVKGQGHESPIFLTPAIEQDGRIQSTLHMEKKPTVVSVVNPRWPAPVSAWERKYTERLERAGEMEHRNAALLQQRDDMSRRLTDAILQSAVARENLRTYEHAMKADRGKGSGKRVMFH